MLRWMVVLETIAVCTDVRETAKPDSGLPEQAG